jgi:predicted SprT family Zn-dependent metalloprotease
MQLNNNMTKITREEWLNTALNRIEPLFGDIKFPDNIRVSCGFCSIAKPKKIVGIKIHVLGVCCPSEFSNGGFTEIFIDPIVDDSSRVLDILVHEVIHAILGSGKGHGKEFKQLALSVGLEGKMTSTTASPELKEKLDKIVEEIGEYPHKAYELKEKDGEPEEKEKKEKQKIINLRCKEDDILVKTHETNITEREIMFTCPVCNNELEWNKKK